MEQVRVITAFCHDIAAAALKLLDFPLVFAFMGIGNVSRCTQEIFLLKHLVLDPANPPPSGLGK
jgi:hypothetical protein